MIPFGPWHPDKAGLNASIVLEAVNCLPAVNGFRPLKSLAAATGYMGEDYITDELGDLMTDESGLYLTSAKDPSGQVGLAWYDRVAGTLVAARQSGGAWVTTVVDGGGSPPTDCGIGAALAIDSGGEWHLAYVDGYAETLKYARLAPDGSVAAIETVDEGISAGAAPFADGKHIIGDDASIHVSGSGSVRIAYQDATAVKLRTATASLNGSTHDWALSMIEGEGARGYFSEIVADGESLSVVSSYRLGKGELKGDVEVVSP